MIKSALFLLTLLIVFFVQGQDSLRLNIKLNITSEETNQKVKFPSLSLTFSNAKIIYKNGDSLGHVVFNGMIDTKVNKVLLEINAEGKYTTKRLFLNIDTLLKEVYLDTLLSLGPEIICKDTWSFPILYFQSNNIELDSASKISYEESNIKEWINNVVIPLGFKVELIGYVGFGESLSIGKKRLRLVQNKFNKLGLIIDNDNVYERGKKAYSFHKNLDGCYPYYMFDENPLLINERLLMSNELFREYYDAKRRVVIVNLIK